MTTLPTSLPTGTNGVANLERISIEVTHRCQKACWFCYNHSDPDGGSDWTSADLLGFVSDCAAHGVKAVSFGGGEPLQYDGLFDVLAGLRGKLFRSITTNGLLLSPTNLDTLVAAGPDKVHVSIHFPERCSEVERVIRNVHELAERGIRSGVNFVVARANLPAAQAAAKVVRAAGIGNDRIVYLPMRGMDTPTPKEMASVAGDQHFQSMTCLLACGPSPRFCSIRHDRTVAWCSYTATRRMLAELTYQSLLSCLNNLGLEFCGGTDGS